MCFSAPVSFIASGILASTGVATLTKIKSKREIPAASVPLLFAIQQISEGVMWLIPKASGLAMAMSYVFLTFAYLIWPIYTPLSIFLIEKDKNRKKIILIFLIIGAALSIYLLVFLILNPILTKITNNHIQYITEVPYTNIGVIIYIITVCGSCFLSSHRVARLFGIAVLVSAFLAAQIYKQTFTSVWCFFAAALSIMIYLYFMSRKSSLFHKS